MKLTRRSFVLGGTASFFGAAAFLSGCNHKIGDKEVGFTDSIKVALVDHFDKLDYVGSVNPTVVSIGWHIYEGLYDLNPQTNEVYPALAIGEPVKLDDTTYEIELRKDAKFSNDSIIMPGDIINSFNLAKQKESVKSLLDFIKSVETSGSNKIKLNLNYPIGDVMKQRLSLVKVLPAVTSDIDKESQPVGSGPYAISELNNGTDTSIFFVPNSNYNGPLAVPKDPMVWTVPADGNTRSGALKGGAVAICEDLPLDKIYELRDANCEVEFLEGFENAIFSFNTRKDVFKHKELRQAVYYAINTEKIIEDKMMGHAGKVDCLLCPNNKDYHKASTVYNYNPAKAKQLIESVKDADLEINFITDKNCWAYKFTEYVIQDLEAVGFKCNVNEVEFTRTDVDQKLSEADFDICMSTLERSLHGANADFLLNYIYFRDSYMNVRTGYSELPDNKWEELKQLITASAVSSDNDRQKIYKNCFDIIAEEAVYYPFVRKEQVTGFDSNKISGFKPISTGGIYCLGTTLK